jgi:hypothetical protein
LALVENQIGMNGLCLTAGGKTIAIAIEAFSLLWTHSVERTEWREEWRIEGERLVIESAFIQGSGAGMEPPAGAIPVKGGWSYHPKKEPLESLDLSRSEFSPDYQICWKNACRSISEILPLGPTKLFSCPPERLR